MRLGSRTNASQAGTAAASDTATPSVTEDQPQWSRDEKTQIGLIAQWLTLHGDPHAASRSEVSYSNHTSTITTNLKCLLIFHISGHDGISYHSTISVYAPTGRFIFLPRPLRRRNNQNLGLSHHVFFTSRQEAMGFKMG